MKAILTTVIAAALLTVGAVATAEAPAANPVVGTWVIDLAKSTFNPGPPPKSDTRTYAQTADGLSMTWKYVGADGKEIIVETTFKADGKDYPVKGSPNFDTLAVTQIDSRSVKSEQKRGGKVIGHSTRTVSADGKVLTLTGEGTTPSGAKFDNVWVYDRK